MFLKTKFCLVLLVVGVILGSIGSAYDSTLTFAQNSSGNAPGSAKGEGAIVEGQSDIPHFPSVSCAATKEKVPTLGIRFNAVNATGVFSGWWNIPGSGSGNNTGGHISGANVQNRTYELIGTMDYDFLCAQKGDLNYSVSITGKCGLETVIRYRSNNEVSSHDFIGHVICR
jgi:hypothetical protein